MQAILALVSGLALLVVGADRFVSGAASSAKYFKIPSLLIGVVVIGFGTSAPELIVSTTAAIEGSAGISLGNAYGSNIVNIGLILGLTALLSPVLIQENVQRREIPILVLVTAISAALIANGVLLRIDGIILLLVFSVLMYINIKQSMAEVKPESQEHHGEINIKKSMFFAISGLIVLIVSSRLLVWGAVTIAKKLGVNDLIIGLTIVAVGTSLPELASSIAAVRKGENELVVGNIIGSNFFNTLAVVGVAGVISPFPIPREVLIRDFPVMALITVVLYFMAKGKKGEVGKISRPEGAVLLVSYIVYTAFLIYQARG